MADVIARCESKGQHVVRLTGQTELHPATPSSIARSVDLKTPTAAGHRDLTAVERNEQTFRISRCVLPDGKGHSTTQELRFAGHADARADSHVTRTVQFTRRIRIACLPPFYTRRRQEAHRLR